MIRITQIKLPIEHDSQALKNSVCRMLHIKASGISSLQIIRRAIDARHKDDLKYVYTVLVDLKNENTCSFGEHKNIMYAEPVLYHFPFHSERTPDKRPVIIGSGPAGLFCGLFLAENGFCPLILERGADVDQRTADVEKFWKTGALDPSSNVQFGEGGAGTFSDGKLNTGISDRSGRVTEVLKTFHKYGGPQEILFDAHPHLGSDLLKIIVRNIREAIIKNGGEFRFHTCVSDLCIRDGKLKGLITRDGRTIETEFCILAPGHSARDTFLMLKKQGVKMEPKPFSAGVRIIHPQKLINDSQWGSNAPEFLGAANYKLSAQTPDGRGVYSFCMCPGGYVVNASSETERLAVNGMSYSGRGSGFANSAIVSGILPNDCLPYADDIYQDELSGIALQQKMETLCFRAGNGEIPVQRFSDFQTGTSCHFDLPDAVKGRVHCGDLTGILPEQIRKNLILGIRDFGQKIKGFDGPDVPLLGVESRTSSPVRILRDETLESSIKGLYPCGEGAGYAGGITSAAVDGIRTAEAVSLKILTAEGRDSLLK